MECSNKYAIKRSRKRAIADSSGGCPTPEDGKQQQNGVQQQCFSKKRKRISPTTTTATTTSLCSTTNGNEESFHSLFVDGTVTVYRRDKPFSLSYRIYNCGTTKTRKSDDVDTWPLSSLSSSSYAPLIILHGGPGLPSEYLYPLVDLLPTKQRPIVFYDQLGCGRSSEPKDVKDYSISQSIDDLEALLQHLNLQQFHLYGHSYGGVLAYEYVKRHCTTSSQNSSMMKDEEPKCQSVLLSNTPTSFHLSNHEWERILREDCNNNDDLFFKRNQCRTETIPNALMEAFRHVGSVWIGTDVVADYVASSPPEKLKHRSFPPALVMKGQYDFVTDVCTKGWKDIFDGGGGGGDSRLKEVMMKGCAHYCHFEDGKEMYGSVVDSFCLEND